VPSFVTSGVWNFHRIGMSLCPWAASRTPTSLVSASPTPRRWRAGAVLERTKRECVSVTEKEFEPSKLSWLQGRLAFRAMRARTCCPS